MTSAELVKNSVGAPKEFDEHIRWVLSITGADSVREYELDHRYKTESSAAKEAESIADVEFREDDIGWAISPKSEDISEEDN